MKNMEELKDMLCEELDKIVEKGTISMGDLEIVHKLTDTMKNIDKIEMYEGGSEYSGDGDWVASGNYSNGSNRRMYNSGRSYADRGYSGRSRHYVRGHYSYGDDTEMLTERLEHMMNEGGMSQSEKDTLRRAVDILRK